MYFYERFELLLESSGASIADLSKATGIKYTTLDSIIKKKQKSTDMGNVSKLADFFGVSMEWLATGAELQKDSGQKELSPNMKKAIEKIASMEEQEVKAVLAFLSSLEGMR